jgi:hypothetical protein
MTKQYSDGALEIQKAKYDAAHRRPKKHPKLSMALSIILIAAVVGGASFVVGKYLGKPVIPLGSERVEMQGYTQTVTRSLGYNVYHFQGESVNYKVFLPWGREPEQPMVLGDVEFDQLMDAVAQYCSNQLKARSEYKYLEMGSFAGMHVYHAEMEGSSGEVYKLIGRLAVADYAVYDGQVYMMEDGAQTIPVVLKGWMRNGKMEIYDIWMPHDYGPGYDSIGFKEQFPEGIQIYLRNEDVTAARLARDKAAEEALGGTITVNTIEVTQDGHMTIYEPDLENYDPAVDDEVPYIPVKEVQLQPLH